MYSVLLASCLLALLPLYLATDDNIPEPYLLFSTWYTVSRMNLDGSQYTVLVDSSSNVGIQAVDYHWRESIMFWGHYRDGTINQADLDGSNSKVIVSVNRPSGLAVDWINDKMYFSFGDPGSNEATPNHLAIYNITTGVYTEITPATPFAVYYELAVDPISEKLYWTTGSRVLQSTLSGDDVQTLLTTGSFIRSLTYNNNIYFLNGFSSSWSVHSLNVTTLEESIIVESANVSVGDGVAVYEDTVFWTGNARVYSTSVNGSGVISELLYITRYGGSFFRGITVVLPYLNNISSTTDPDNQSYPNNISDPSPTAPDNQSSSPSVLIPVLVTLSIILLIVSLIVISSGIVCYYKKYSKGRINFNSCNWLKFNPHTQSIHHNNYQNTISKTERSLDSEQPRPGTTTDENNSFDSQHDTDSANNLQEHSSVATTQPVGTVPNTELVIEQGQPSLHQNTESSTIDHTVQLAHSKPDNCPAVQPKLSILTENELSFQPAIPEEDIHQYIPAPSEIAEKEKPSLPELLKFEVPQKVGANYKQFGIFLLNDKDGSLINTMEVDCQGMCERIVIKILSEWLRGVGKPVAWKELITTLCDCKLTSLANHIQRNINS